MIIYIYIFIYINIIYIHILYKSFDFSINESWQLLAFFSKQLRPSQTRYSIFNPRQYGLFLEINHLKFSLFGSSLTIGHNVQEIRSMSSTTVAMIGLHL